MINAIEYKKDGVRLSFYGKITSNEIMDANTEMINHPEFESFHYQLWIFDPVEDFVLSTNDLQEMAKQDKKASERNSNIKVAIFSTSQFVFGLGRMYEAFYGDGPWRIMIFYNLDEAEKWIFS